MSTSKNKTQLKGYFETGDTPSEAQYADLIDSNLNLATTTAQQVSSDIYTSNTIMFNNSNTSGITYADSTGNVRHGLQFSRTSNLVSLTNNAANGFVQIKANGSSAGSGGEVTSSIFTSYSNEFLMPITASGNVSASGEFIGASANITNISSSGNISASGNIEGDIYSSNGNVFAQFTNDAVNVGGSISKPLVLSGTTIKLGLDNSLFPVQHVTASGNISSSGNLIVNEITASGNISSSGTITGNNLLIDGSQVDFSNLPTSDPGVAGRLFSNNIYVKISQG